MLVEDWRGTQLQLDVTHTDEIPMKQHRLVIFDDIRTVVLGLLSI